MKKVFIMMIMAAIMVGCHKDNITGDTPPAQEGSAAIYSGKLTLNVGQNVTKAFDEHSNWTWEKGDVIIGYQNYGDKHLNKLIFKEGDTFVCENFVYSTEDPAEFCFFYYGKDDVDVENITAIQDGTWRPVLYVGIPNTILSDINEVYMRYYSSAIEFQLFFNKSGDINIPFNIKSAKLTSNNDFVGKWGLSNSGIEGSLNGKEIEITLPESSNTNAIVFNVLPITNVEGTKFTITLTSAIDETITKEFEFNPEESKLSAGERITYNIDAEVSAKILNASAFNTKIKEKIEANECTKIRFITNKMPPSDGTIENNISYTFLSDISSEIGSNVPIYLVKYGFTLQIYTPADKFKAPADCTGMFANLTSIEYIQGMGKDFDTSDATNMNSMFKGCTNLKNLSVEYFNTSKVTDMSYMFQDCKSIAQTPESVLDLSSFTFDFTYDSGMKIELIFDFNSTKKVQVFVTKNVYDLFQEYVDNNYFDNQFLGDDYEMTYRKQVIIK